MEFDRSDISPGLQLSVSIDIQVEMYCTFAGNVSPPNPFIFPCSLKRIFGYPRRWCLALRVQARPLLSSCPARSMRLRRSCFCFRIARPVLHSPLTAILTSGGAWQRSNQGERDGRKEQRCSHNPGVTDSGGFRHTVYCK